MAEPTTDSIISPGALIAGFIAGAFLYTLGAVAYYALDIQLTRNIILGLVGLGIAGWAVTTLVVGRAR